MIKKWTTHIMHTNINDAEYVKDIGNFLKSKYTSNNWPVDLKEIDLFKDDGHKNELFNKAEQFITKCVNEYLLEVFESNYLVCEGSELSIDVHATNHKTIGAHQHNSAIISGVFYVEIDSGELIMHDPRGTASRGYPNDPGYAKYFGRHSIMPKPGDIILFPGFLTHEVAANTSDLPRIIIPFDISEEVND